MAEHIIDCRNLVDLQSPTRSLGADAIQVTYSQETLVLLDFLRRICSERARRAEHKRKYNCLDLDSDHRHLFREDVRELPISPYVLRQLLDIREWLAENVCK